MALLSESDTADMLSTPSRCRMATSAPAAHACWIADRLITELSLPSPPQPHEVLSGKGTCACLQAACHGAPVVVLLAVQEAWHAREVQERHAL